MELVLSVAHWHFCPSIGGFGYQLKRKCFQRVRGREKEALGFLLTKKNIGLYIL